MEGLFEQMNTEKLPYWEGQLFFHFPKGSVQATQLLPQGRAAFQKGTYEQRILAIKTLGDKCALIPALNPLSVNVLAFHTQIASARALQQSDGEGQVATLRDLRETARVALCNEMYGNMGQLVYHFRTDPLQVERFYDFALLRRKKDATSTEASIKGTVFKVGTTTGVPNATITVTIEGKAPMVTQTNANGAFEMSLGELTETVNVTMDVAAEGFMPYSNSGPVEPGEELEVEVELTPAP